MGRSGWDDEPRGRARPPSNRRPFDDDRPASRSGSRGGSSSRSHGYDDERDDYLSRRSRGYDDRPPSSSSRGGSSTRNRGYDDEPRRSRSYDDDEPPRRNPLPAPWPGSRAAWDAGPAFGRAVGGGARAGRFGTSDDEDDEQVPSNSGATVGIVAAGVVLGVVLGIVFAIGYYRASAPKLPGGTPTQQTTPSASPGTTPSASPHTFVPPSPGSADSAVRLVIG